jgi:hypothetical protein
LYGLRLTARSYSHTIVNEFSQGLGERCRLVLCRLPARGSLFHSLPLALASRPELLAVPTSTQVQSTLSSTSEAIFREPQSEVPPYHEFVGSRGTAAAVPVSGLLWVAEGEATHSKHKNMLGVPIRPGVVVIAQRTQREGREPQPLGPHAPRMTMQRLTCDST